MTQVKVGDKLYLQQGGKSSGYVRDVKNPYTVVSISNDGKTVYIRECALIFKGLRYYDTLPDAIQFNPDGALEELHWSDKIEGGCWWAYKKSCGRDYPLVAHFGSWEYYPYLD